MSIAFEKGVKAGGIVILKNLSGGRYQRFCKLKGKLIAGEITQKKVNPYSEALK